MANEVISKTQTTLAIFFPMESFLVGYGPSLSTNVVIISTTGQTLPAKMIFLRRKEFLL